MRRPVRSLSLRWRGAPGLLLLAGCALAVLAPPAQPQGWITDDGSRIDPGADGAMLSAAGLLEPQQLLDLLIDEAVPADGPALSVAVMRAGALVAQAARGLADREHGAPATTASVFDLASVSKSMTAAALARLVVAGDVALEDSVRRFLPELSQAYEPVQLAHLVHHTGGVEDVQGLLCLAGWRDGEPGSFADGLSVLARQPALRFAPGSQHQYSNGGYLLLAEVVARVTGRPFAAELDAALFEPLGMDSAVVVGEIGQLIPGRAVPCDQVDGRWLRRAATARAGAGGVFCTVPDLARWGEALRSGAGLGEEVAALMRRTGVLTDGTAVDYAFGMGRTTFAGRPAWSHAGSELGARSALIVVPDEQLVLAAASNALDGPDPWQTLEELAGLLLGPAAGAEAATGSRPRMVLIPEDQAAPEVSLGVAVDAAELQRYGGSYLMSDGQADVEYVLTVAAEGEQLRIGFDDEPTLAVFPLPSGRFLIAPAGYELSFEPERGQVSLHITEQSQRRGAARTIVGRRQDESPPTAAELRELVGVYRSPALGAFYELASADGALELRHARHGSLRLRRLAADTWLVPGRALSRLIVQRRRGTVTGIELEAYSWGARALFERL